MFDQQCLIVWPRPYTFTGSFIIFHGKFIILWFYDPNFFYTDIKIQSETHDSTEDAYTAVKLFFKYQEIINTSGEEQFDHELEILYDTGRQLNWQIPDWTFYHN